MNSVSAYDYEPEGPDRRHYETMKKDCNVIMTISLQPDFSTPGLVSGMDVVIQGPKRIAENFIATDAFLDKALSDEVAKGAGGAPAPKL
jgi:hypothetical protein